MFSASKQREKKGPTDLPLFESSRSFCSTFILFKDDDSLKVIEFLFFLVKQKVIEFKIPYRGLHSRISFTEMDDRNKQSFWNFRILQSNSLTASKRIFIPISETSPQAKYPFEASLHFWKFGLFCIIIKSSCPSVFGEATGKRT